MYLDVENGVSRGTLLDRKCTAGYLNRDSEALTNSNGMQLALVNHAEDRSTIALQGPRGLGRSLPWSRIIEQVRQGGVLKGLPRIQFERFGPSQPLRVPP